MKRSPVCFPVEVRNAQNVRIKVDFYQKRRASVDALAGVG